MGEPSSDAELLRSVELLQRRLAGTRERLVAQDERLARLRDDLSRLKTGYSSLRTAPPRSTRKDLAPALALLALTIVVGGLRESRALRMDAAARLKDAVASPPAEKPAPTMTPPTGDNAVAEGLRLVYAYQPTAARVTVGEILEPLLGKDLKPTSFELFPAQGNSFRIVFKPYTDDVGLAHQYDFEVDSARGRVTPSPDTQALLRTDAAGLLASRSDLEGLRQALDLSRDGEVLVGKPADRMGR